jgi:hypothetical protein
MHRLPTAAPHVPSVLMGKLVSTEAVSAADAVPDGVAIAVALAAAAAVTDDVAAAVALTAAAETGEALPLLVAAIDAAAAAAEQAP